MNMNSANDRTKWLAAVLSLAVVSGLTNADSSARAQDQPGAGRGPNYQDLPEFRANGTIKGLAPGGMLQVEVNESESWLVQVLPNNRGARFVGSAEPDWLMPGMWVNFTTRFNKRGQAVEPVKLLTVFTPNGNRGREEGARQPGVVPLTNPGAEISFAGEEKVKPKEDTVLCEVTGVIQGLGKGSLAILAGATAVQVALAEEATISVDVADLRPARVGDKVEVNGRQLAPGKGVAMRVEVKGSEPLSSKPSAGEEKGKVASREPRPMPAASTTSATKTPPSSGVKKLPLLGQKPAAPKDQIPASPNDQIPASPNE